MEVRGTYVRRRYLTFNDTEVPGRSIPDTEVLGTLVPDAEVLDRAAPDAEVLSRSFCFLKAKVFVLLHLS